MALAQKIREDFRNIPIPTLIYTGTESAVEQTRLEAFVYQVQQFAKKRKPSENDFGPTLTRKTPTLGIWPGVSAALTEFIQQNLIPL